MSDVHIGGWRDPKLSELGLEAFGRAIDICIEKKVDFVLISGDLFDTSLPSVDRLKTTVIHLRKVKNAKIPVYIIAGSHDFSPSGKTMLDVLEEAQLVINVVKGEIIDNKLKLRFTIDEKTGVKITGMLGKKGCLEKKYYENLLKHHLEEEDGYKIFMFHSALEEFKPKGLENMEANPLSLLPKNFNYYAGGHVHYIFDKQEPGYGLITYPGALFPNNFAELEKYGRGGFYIVENDNLDWIPVQIYSHAKIEVLSNHNSPREIENNILSEIDKLELKNSIVTIRVHGTLENGKVFDIDFNKLFEAVTNKGAYFVMKNTSALKTKEFEEIKVNTIDSKDVEIKLIKEHIGQIKVKNLDLEQESQLTSDMMNLLNTMKQEGEKVVDFEKRVVDGFKGLLRIE